MPFDIGDRISTSSLTLRTAASYICCRVPARIIYHLPRSSLATYQDYQSQLVIGTILTVLLGRLTEFCVYKPKRH